MCNMKTDAMKRRDITNTGTGPLKPNRKQLKIAQKPLTNSPNLHFDSRRIISVEPPHATGASTAASCPRSCCGGGFPLPHGTTAASSTRCRCFRGRSCRRAHIGRTRRCRLLTNITLSEKVSKIV